MKIDYPYQTFLDLNKQDVERSIRIAITAYKAPAMLDANRFFAELLESCGVDSPEYAAEPMFMTWDEARVMTSKGMSIGSHTHEHDLLARLPLDRQYDECVKSKAILEDELKVPVHSIAYPVGSNASYSSETIECVRQAGYRLAFSFSPGVNMAGQIAPYALRRTSIDLDMSKARFRMRTALAASNMAVDW